MRVAVASSDGIVVNAHFGRTPKFYIYEMNEEGSSLLEVRNNLPGCSSLDQPLGTMEDSIQLISDCPLLLVGMIGKPMIQRLAMRGIKAVVMRDMIESALTRSAETYL